MALEFDESMQPIQQTIDKLRKLEKENNEDYSEQIARLEHKLEKNKKEVYKKLSPWQITQIARFAQRPVLQDYIEHMCDEFIELHGDRCFGDDRGLIGGFATIDSYRCMLIGHNKGKDVKQQSARNFGMASPEGYRKALRLMELAQKYALPVVTLVDTQGAFPGIGAEQRGQAEAIARNLARMADLRTPIITVVTGEGGSGGALGIGVGDVVCMCEYAVYSVISPEGCAAILWKDSSKAPEAAKALKITAKELKKFGIVDEIIPEPNGGAHADYAESALQIKKVIVKHLQSLCKYSSGRLVRRREKKIAKIGTFIQSEEN